jgi:putative ABC transport system permease protein
MAAAGIITMPGIITGQSLAGMDPLSAAKYQILLMFVLSAAGFLGSLIAAYAAALTKMPPSAFRADAR